jgi:tetratricopeptide (TPR) repeat protein
LRRLASVPVVVFACLASGRTSPATPPITELLDRYVAGQFDAAMAQLSERSDFGDLLKQLKSDGPAWINAQGPAERPRRELAAATFALEAARVDEWREWKWVQRQPSMDDFKDAPHAGSYQPLDALTWKPAPLFIEWGCALLRQHETPLPIERWWQLAALAVAQRGEDSQFLIGDLNIGLGAVADETGNPKAEITHLDHVAARFPNEARFGLAQGIAREWHRDSLARANALVAFEAVRNDLDVGAEAAMRVGAMALRAGHPGDALPILNDADRQSRDRYVVYLARFFKGQAYEQLRRPVEAEITYRGAAATVPNAQSAAMALAALLFARDQRLEAQRLAEGAIASDPPAADPWREYAHADDRFWPRLIARLRAEILK